MADLTMLNKESNCFGTILFLFILLLPLQEATPRGNSLYAFRSVTHGFCDFLNHSSLNVLLHEPYVLEKQFQPRLESRVLDTWPIAGYSKIAQAGWDFLDYNGRMSLTQFHLVSGMPDFTYIGSIKPQISSFVPPVVQKSVALKQNVSPAPISLYSPLHFFANRGLKVHYQGLLAYANPEKHLSLLISNVLLDTRNISSTSVCTSNLNQGNSLTLATAVKEQDTCKLNFPVI